MNINDHDRDRVVALAHEFIDMILESYGGNGEILDVTLDQFMIIGICELKLNEDTTVEVPVRTSSTRRPFIQRGILESILDLMRAPDGIVIADEEE